MTALTSILSVSYKQAMKIKGDYIAVRINEFVKFKGDFELPKVKLEKCAVWESETGRIFAETMLGKKYEIFAKKKGNGLSFSKKPLKLN